MEELTKEQMDTLIDLCRELVLTEVIDAIDIQPILKGKSWRVDLMSEGKVLKRVLMAL